MKKIKTIFLTIIIVFIVFTLGARLFGIETSVPISSSMHPTIPKYSYVYVKKIKSEADLAKLKEGDIIEFDYGESYPVMHRIIKIEGNEITTKGDHSETASEETFSKEKVLGVVLFSIPYLGIMFINNIYPWIILLFIIAMYYGFKYVIKELKKK